MTRDYIIQKAREAGAFVYGNGVTYIDIKVEQLQHLIDAVVAGEREECAKLIEPKNDHSDWTDYARTKAECAAAIRSRGTK